jgi:hypothetical protein
MQKIYFKEEQRFTQPWLWVILIVSLSVAIIPIVAGLYVQIIEGRPYGEKPASTTTLLILFFVMSAISTGVIWLFWITKLITEVRQDGIYLKFVPFFLKMKKFSAYDIAEYKVRTYRPIREYGGWGVRVGLRGYGRAYNVKGKTGMQLVFKDDKLLLIGTQRGEAFLRAMNKMMKEE